MKANSVSLVIPTLNRPESLERTLKTYFDSNCYPDEVIIIDQSNSVEARRKNKTILKQYTSKSKCKYLYQEKPSLTAARNLGIKNVSSDLIVFSDDDIDVFKDTILKVKNAFMDESIAMIGGIDIDNNQNDGLIGCLFGTKSLIRINEGHVTKSVLGRFPRKFTTNRVPTMWAMGFFFVVKRDLVRKWNLEFDEKLLSYAYAEDLDFTLEYYRKSMKENLKCIFDKEIYVRHLASKEYREPTRKATFMYVEHRYYLLKKHRLAKTSFWYTVTNLMIILQKLRRKESLKDFFDALVYLQQNRARIIRGEFYYGE